jgi:pimeloyl-ACP methyl ester carboxylesterase
MVGRIVELALRPSERLTPGPGMQDQLRPRILGRIADEGCKRDAAVLILHPAVNFMHHYMIEPLQERGIAAMGLNTRFAGNDSQLLMEQVIQDLGAGVRHLREQGYKRVVLFGNSGGGSVASLYQAQAEHFTLTTTPDGAPFDLRREDVPPVDAIVLASAHTSRAHQLRDCLDASVIDESDPLAADPDLDMFNRANGPPYGPEFLQRYRAAQLQRYESINEWVLKRLRQLAVMGEAARAVDSAFVIHRTYARPETLDNAIDPNDRLATGTIWGGAVATNYSPNVLGRYTTLRSFLSQWSKLSRADGPARLAETSVPVMNAVFSADEGIYPSESARYTRAAAGRCTEYVLKGATHFPYKQPDGDRIIGALADRVAEWVGGLR